MKERDIILEDCAEIIKRIDFSALKNKRVLITGANGLIGQYLVSTLYVANTSYNLGCRVQCVSLHGPNAVLARYLPNKLIVFKKIDLTSPFKIYGKFDYIFHAAGYGQPSKFSNDPSGTIAINIDATETLLNIAERSKGTFVLFSSAEVYGTMPTGMVSFKEDFMGNAIFPEGPRAIYGASKRLSEALALYFAKHRAVRVRIVRISNVYGPGASIHDARVMSDFIRSALSKRIITLLDAGRSVRTYGYLADAVSMIFHVALKGESIIYNVGGRDIVSIRELAERVGAQCDAEVRIPKIASQVHFIGKDPKLVKLNLSKIRREMKKFSFTPFRVGLANTIAWARQNI